ncbi:MAG: sugar phosphate isomerase/epimerase [Armatimonadetes bacterium]|nr:sugar phosphate isomerase/epimerase [Armatimonadota bacterium]
MEYIYFTKTLKALDVAGMVEALKRMGADGADLCVRDGYAVNPANARAELPKAVEQFKRAGLSVPMISAPTGLHSPDDPASEALFAACHDAGVPYLKPGYWSFRPGDYDVQLTAARKELDGWARLAKRYGVKCCIHTHSGSYLTVNTGAARLVVDGSDPVAIGLYLDPGHLALNGEPLTMALAMAGPRLTVLAIKDLMWERVEGRGVRKVVCKPLGEGFVNWRELMLGLRARSFAGPLTFHSEYDGLTDEAMLEQARNDIAYLRAIEKEEP